jgi:ankyrin repeat protein
MTSNLLRLLLQDGQTPLFYAAGFGHVEVVGQLLMAGAAVNASGAVRCPPKSG